MNITINEEEYDITKEIKDGKVVITAVRKTPNAPTEDFLGVVLSADGRCMSSVSLEDAKACYDQGNWFPTIEGSIHTKKGRKLKKKLISMIKEANVRWKADLNDETQEKFYISLDNKLHELMVSYFISCQVVPTKMLIRSESLAKNIMAEFTVEEYRMILDA